MAVVVWIKIQDDETGLAGEYNKVGVETVVLTKDARLVLAARGARHVRQSPGGPEAFHEIGKSGDSAISLVIGNHQTDQIGKRFDSDCHGVWRGRSARGRRRFFVDEL